jgi:hypothetical protein
MKQATSTYPPRKEATPSKANRETTTNVSRIDQVTTSAVQNPSPSFSSSSASSSATPEKSVLNDSRPSIDQGVADQERIRQRAYELYVESGYRDGRAEEDWFEAERELQRKRKS